MKRVAIVGGGLAGLISGIQLLKKGVPCILFEKKKYPLHKVCGEYISNETVSFLKQNHLYPEKFNPSQISALQLTSISGDSATMPLDLGGFGISRFHFDHFLFQEAEKLGLQSKLETEVEDLDFSHDKFIIKTNEGEYNADVVVGAFGKRSKLDVKLDRSFTKKRSPYVGVKYHVRCTHPDDVIALHNFEGGYCGVVKINDRLTNICYLVHREVVKRFGSIAEMEKNVLFKNPFLKKIFTEAEFVYEKPLVINEISFATKGPVENHVLYSGDAAGMITPLCGNGMAMAIHSGKIISELVGDFCHSRISRHQLEKKYKNEWTKNFANRLRVGRVVQNLFGNATASRLAVNLILHSKLLSTFIVRNTHGRPF